MTYTEFPADEDIKGFLADQEYATPCNLSYEGYADAAKREFERRTGRIPFLKDSVNVERFYDPPVPSAHGQFLALDAGLLEVSSVMVGVSTTNPGVVLTQGSDYVLHDYNAPVEGRPYERIQFVSSISNRFLYQSSPHIGGSPRSIKVTGKWGYSATVPDDVYFAVLRLGVSLALMDLKEALAGDLVEWAEGDTRERLSIELIQKLGAGMTAYVDRVVSRYLFIT